MKLKNNRAYKGISLALMTILLHLSVGATMAAPAQVIAKLLTTGGTVKVNDNDSPSGTSIVSGATIETPDNIAATIQIGDLGIVELPPGSLAVLEYSGNNIKVTLKRGCAILETNKNTTGSVVNTDGKLLQTNSNAEEGMPGDANYRRMSRAANSDGTMRRRLPVCGLVPAGPIPVPGPGITPVPGPIGGGLSAGAIGAIIAGVVGGAVIVGIIGTRGGDSSPSRP